MTSFFVPGALSGGEAERAYDELRIYAEARAGQTTRATRIEALQCRRGGADSEVRVGESDPCGGGTVHAIFATGDSYAVVWEGGHAILSKRQIYQAIPFD